MSGTNESSSSRASMIALADARRLSPSTIRVNRPYRSVMWCGCQGVCRRYSAKTGTLTSISAQTTNATSCAVPDGMSRNSAHSTCTAAMPRAYRRVEDRSSPALREARSHCAIIATRITMYPITGIVKSPCSNAAGMPAATTSTPPICTNVVTR